MQALSHSTFLQALGYAIANSLWQMALLWIVASFLTGVFRFPAATRYRIALLAQVAGFTWFLFTLQFYYHACSEAAAIASSVNMDVNSSNLLQTATQPGFHARLLTVVVYIEQMLPYLSVAYLCLLLFLFVRWMQQYNYTRHIRTAGLEKIEVDWRLFTQRLSSTLGIKNKVQIYLSSFVNSPLTIGFLKPVILIPLASINLLTTEQMEAVIVHELAHIKRADYLVNLLQCIMEIALFFNPFSQLLSRMVRNERENSCDDWVLQFQYNAAVYAEALLRIAYLPAAPALAMNAAGPVKGDLLSRVKRMLQQKEQPFPYKQQLLALVLMTGILSSVAWFQPLHSTTASTTAAAQPTTQSTARALEPITARVDNPLFSPVFFLTKPLQEEVSKAVISAGTEMAGSAQVIRQVQYALDNVTPVLKNIDIDREINTSLEAASVSLDHMNMNMNMPAEEHLTQLQRDAISHIDTAAINRSIQAAMVNLKNAQVNADWQRAQADFVRAKDAMSKAFRVKQRQDMAIPQANEINATITESIRMAMDMAGQKMEGMQVLEQFMNADTIRKIEKQVEQQLRDVNLQLQETRKQQQKVHMSEEDEDTYNWSPRQPAVYIPDTQHFQMDYHFAKNNLIKADTGNTPGTIVISNNQHQVKIILQNNIRLQMDSAGKEAVQSPIIIGKKGVRINGKEINLLIAVPRKLKVEEF